jgi:hypothetical protein
MAELSRTATAPGAARERLRERASVQEADIAAAPRLPALEAAP